MPPDNLLVPIIVVAVSVFWTIGIVRWSLRRRPSMPPTPSVSVIVAGRNEEYLVAGCLESLAKLQYPQRLLEICFVDDHSVDRTIQVANQVAATSQHRMMVLEAPDCPPDTGPKKNALAYGVRHTTGEILAFTDADGMVHPGWIHSLVSWYDERTGAVVGTSLPPRRRSPGHRLYRIERILAGLTSASAIGHGSPASAGGMSLSYRRQAFDDLGGFAHTGMMSGDDDLMVQAVKRAGWKVRFSHDPDCVVTDVRPPNSREHAAIAIRHQSTARFYPLSWRVIYALTILANASLLVLICGVPLGLASRTTGVATLAGKLAMDGIGAFIYCRKLGITMKWWEFVVAELILPFYSLWRATLAFAPRYTWHGRTHSTAAGHE